VAAANQNAVGRTRATHAKADTESCGEDPCDIAKRGRHPSNQIKSN